jgi:predicted NUDIX family NTP pyrophosphohydrolase
MVVKSAGVLMYRGSGPDLEVFLVHPGGPFFAKKDDGAWSIPKGLFGDDEEPLHAARREFAEETGFAVAGEARPLGVFRQPGGKVITAFAVEGEVDPSKLKSNSFTMEWPPKSGRQASFPEIDRGAWFHPHEAARKILKGQRPILAALFARLTGQEAG